MTVISVFDMFKIGLGPSSSHTMGPMIAAKRFLAALPAGTSEIMVTLYGSLAWTGRGHGTDSAVCLGLLGHDPATIDPDTVEQELAKLEGEGGIEDEKIGFVVFRRGANIIFDTHIRHPRHSNALKFSALGLHGALLSEKLFYSVGGGFVIAEGEEIQYPPSRDAKYDFTSASELLRVCEASGLSIATVQRANEETGNVGRLDDQLDEIVAAMFRSIERGLRNSGELPGPLGVQRRAKALAEKLTARGRDNVLQSFLPMEWASAFAMAVNEENACGRTIVTAPTNGAAGIVPAVLRYYRDFIGTYSAVSARDFLLTAAAFGGIIKRNASISGAELGCQGEVGSAAAMAAAGLTAVLGGTPRQVENAAEIAIEHHLGMTCDPVGGLVQIPCIERNAIAANKAINAAALAIAGNGEHRVSFDQAVEAMRQTGIDMGSKYKETSQGGLAVSVAAC